MNFLSEQVSINSSLLPSNSSFMHIFWFFGGHALLKKGGPKCMRVVQGQPMYTFKGVKKDQNAIAKSPLICHGTRCMSTRVRGNTRRLISWSMRTMLLSLH
jgi:hypothetical protein